MPSKKKKIAPKYKYIFGPVYSWRLGISLGVDPLSAKAKICSFDCIYCQLGRTPQRSRHRRTFVPTDELVREINAVPLKKIDYVTFAGRGEPTLARNLGAMIKSVRKTRREKIAVITNASLMDQKGVRDDLALADFVLAKLDAWDQASFAKINRPGHARFFQIVRGIKKFRRQFRGKLALQIMFMKPNRDHAACLAALARDIRPDEIQINTPLRENPCLPLSVKEMKEIKKAFYGFPVTMVYEARRQRVRPLNDKSTEKRHGKEQGLS